MTNKDIHISLLPQHKLLAIELLESNKLKKQVIDSDEAMEIVIKNDSKDTLNDKCICEEITDLIINIMKEKLLKEYIEKQCKDTNETDTYIYAVDLFSKKEKFLKETIIGRVSNYILNNDYINIDGFVKFRMKEFMNYISVIGDMALEEYMVKKDQEEFINVLKYFIDIQEEKIDLLRVHIMSDNTFILYDKNGNRIDNLDDEELINMVIKENLNYEDFLISTLLTLCPKKIEILDLMNDNSSKEIIETIISIFGDKVKLILQN